MNLHVAYLGAIVEGTVSNARSEHVDPVDGLQRKVDCQTKNAADSTQQCVSTLPIKITRLQRPGPTAVVPVQPPAPVNSYVTVTKLFIFRPYRET